MVVRVVSGGCVTGVVLECIRPNPDETPGLRRVGA